MTDPRYYAAGRRSPTFNPARASMPISLYGGNIHVVPTARHDTATPRGQGNYRGPPTPTTTTTHYAVTKDPGVTRTTSLRDGSRTRHRAYTETNPSKPIIITTRTEPRPHNSSSHTTSTQRTGSPSRDPYRVSDEGQYYAQPASSIRSRSHNRHHSANLDNEDWYRLRDRGQDDRLRAPRADPYRSSRPTSIYANAAPARSSTAVVDFNEEEYEYWKPSDFAKYDFDHPESREKPRRSRRESFDRPYYRPSVTLSNDIGRYDDRPERGRATRGPPPTSRGLEAYNKHTATYDRGSVTMPVPPVVPVAPTTEIARRSGTLDVPPSPSHARGSSRTRPVSLYQDTPRSSHHDDTYLSRDDERAFRDRRRADEYVDEKVTARGFGIRADTKDLAEPRRETERRDYDDRRGRHEDEVREPRRRSDSELDRHRGRDERPPVDDRARVGRREESRDPKDSKDSGRVRDKVAAGLSVAAAAMGLATNGSGKERDEPADRDGRGSPRKRQPSDEERIPTTSHAADRYKPRDKDLEDRRPSEPIVVEQRRDRTEPKKDRADSKDDHDSRDRSRRDVEPKMSGAITDSKDDSGNSDDNGHSRRRRRPSIAFNPSNTQDIIALKEQLAAQDKEKAPVKEKVPVKERSPVKDNRDYRDSRESRDVKDTRDVRDSKESRDYRDSKDLREVRDPRDTKESRDVRDSRDARDARAIDLKTSSEKVAPAVVDERVGRELVPAESEHQKQVRVVSPPRDKSDQKPIRGILKQPSSKFPEDPNPIREGVAPHKDDKTKKDIPNGARWTKVSRKLVNPEALNIGKERFEERDGFVIVLRVLSKEEIQAYATATAQLRERRKREYEGEVDPEREGEKDRAGDRDRDRDRDDEERRRHRHHRDRDDDDDRRDRDRDYRDRDREREREREREKDHRRHRDETDLDRPRASDYDTHGHRSHRD